MFASIALTNFVLLASYVLAAPAAPNATTHILAKRDTVCGLNFRNLVNWNSCLPRGVAYTLVAPSHIAPVTFTTSAQVPANMQCDHVIELNFLDMIAKDSNLCSLLGPLLKADTSLTSAQLLTPLADHISDLTNLNFIDQNVNNQKNTVVQRAYSNNSPGNTNIDYAVGNYLTRPDIVANSFTVAYNLDDDIAAIIATADSVYATLPDGNGGRDPQTVLKSNLEAAIYAYTSISVAAKWQSVLAAVPVSE